MKILLAAMAAFVAGWAGVCTSGWAQIGIKFDGGFTFVEQRDGSISVLSPRVLDRQARTKHSAHPDVHEPRLYLTATNVRRSDGSLEEIERSLEDKHLTFTLLPNSVETPGPAVDLPSRSHVKQDHDDCDKVPGRKSRKRNRLSWLPDLTALHPDQRVVISPDTVNARVDLWGGQMRVDVAQGCWQLATGTGLAGAPQSLVYGNDSILYSTKTRATTLAVTLAPLDGNGDAETLSFPLGKGVAVEMSIRYPRLQDQPSATNEKMDDFGRHYSILPDVSEADRLIPVAVIDQNSVSDIPGRECGSARVTLTASDSVMK